MYHYHIRMTIIIAILLPIALSAQKSDSELRKAAQKGQEEAKANLMNMEFHNTEEVHTTEAYEQFMAKYPESKFTEKAKAGMRNIEFRGILQTNTIESYEQFIAKYPESEFADIARDKIQLIKLGCNYQAGNLSQKDKIEIEKIFKLIGTSQDIILLTGLYDLLIQNVSLKKNARPLIQVVLGSAIKNNKAEQFSDNTEKVTKLLDFYTFDSTNYPEYSYEAGLSRELQVMTSRQFIRKKISKLPSRKELVNEFTNAVMEGANPQPFLEKSENIIRFRNTVPSLVYAVDLKAMKDLTNKPLSNCARLQYWKLADQILSGIYESPYEYGLEPEDLNMPEFKETPNYSGRLKQKEEKENEIYDLLTSAYEHEEDEFIRNFAEGILERNKPKEQN